MNWYKFSKLNMPPEFWEAGRAKKDGISEEDVDPDELSMGIEIEKEHVDDNSVAKKIALDHLAEIKDYYTRLKKMEDESKK